jgi:hypothetical protein
MHRRLILGLAAFAGLATAMPAFTTAAYAETPHHEVVQARHMVRHTRRAPVRRAVHLKRIIHRAEPRAHVG